MNEAITTWLNSPDKNYQQGLDLLGGHHRNRYLLRSLRLRENKTNRAKMEYELRKVAKHLPIKPAQKEAKPMEAPVLQTMQTPTPEAAEIDLNNMTEEQTAIAVERLEVALGKMHNKKGILSNSLRNCDVNDNEGRKKILDQIEGLNTDMNEIRAKLGYHNKHGKLPPVAGKVEKHIKPIPDDPVAMKDTILNLRSSISKIKKQLKNIPVKDKEYEKLHTRYEEKMNVIKEIESRLHGA
jgi:hypothetical protein